MNVCVRARVSVSTYHVIEDTKKCKSKRVHALSCARGRGRGQKGEWERGKVGGRERATNILLAESGLLFIHQPFSMVRSGGCYTQRPHSLQSMCVCVGVSGCTGERHMSPPLIHSHHAKHHPGVVSSHFSSLKRWALSMSCTGLLDVFIENTLVVAASGTAPDSGTPCSRIICGRTRPI